MIILTGSINILSEQTKLTRASCNVRPKNSNAISDIINESNRYKRYVGEYNSNANGIFEIPYRIGIESDTDIKSLTLEFDKLRNQHPLTIDIVDLESYRVTQTGSGWIVLHKGEQISETYTVYTGRVKPQHSTSRISIVNPDTNEVEYFEQQDLDGYFECSMLLETAKYGEVFETSYSYTYTEEFFTETVKQSFVCESPIFTMYDLDFGKEITLSIKNWNMPNSPLTLFGIYNGIKITLDKRNLISFSQPTFDRGDYKKISYGIISNNGRLEFNDENRNVLEYAERGLLVGNLYTTFEITNTLTKKTQNLGDFYTDNWDYDNDNGLVSVKTKDDLVEWQSIQVEGINFDPRNPYKVLENGTMQELYVWLWDKTPQKYNMLNFNELDDETKKVLANTKLLYPLLEENSLWKQWEKLCQVCALYIYKSKGKTVCHYTLGS